MREGNRSFLFCFDFMTNQVWNFLEFTAGISNGISLYGVGLILVKGAKTEILIA